MAAADAGLSEETFEYQCTAGCFKKNLVKQAVKACVDCKKYFCAGCLDTHNSLLDDHNIVEPSVLLSPKSTSLPTEQCRKHAGKTIDVWCVQHDVVGCVSCALFDHRSCDNIKDIPSEIEDLFKQDEFDGVKIELKRNIEYLKGQQNLLNEDKERFTVLKNIYILNIEQYTKKLIAMILTLEKKAKEDLINKFKEFEDNIKISADNCKRFEENTRQCLEKLDSCIDNKPQLFIDMKNAQKIIALADKSCREPVVADNTVVFKPDTSIEQYLSGLHSLGTSSNVSRRYEIKHKKEINVKMSNDSEECNIEGSCLLKDGSVVVADGRNKKLKHVDITSLSVIDSCTVPGYPYGVCLVGQQELAVALWNKKIQFVTLGRRMTLSRTIDVDHYCYGIAYHNGEMFVSDCGKTIYVYNIQGSLLRKLTNVTSDKCRYMAVSRGEEKVFSACSYGGLVCTDRHGSPIYTYKDKINYCHGVCLDNRSSVFVCGYHSNNVVQVSEDGKEVGEILNSSDGLYHPQTLCFDPSRQRLIITQNSDTVLVFELNLQI